MAETMTKTGSCLCGAVKVTAKSLSKSVGACHCGMCRRWGGGAFMSVDGGTDVVWEGRGHIAVFNSSEHAERGFCRECGTHLFYRFKQTGQYALSLGLFPDEAGFLFDHQIFIDRKSGLYDFANQTSTMTEAEVIAKYTQ